MKCLGIIIACLLLCIKSYAQNEDLFITLYEPVNKKIEIWGYRFTIKINTTNPTKKFLFRQCLKWEYDPNEYKSNLKLYPDENIDGIWIMQKEVNSKYSSNGLRNGDVREHPLGSCPDSLGNELFDTLTIQSPIIINKSLIGYYKFEKGNYRARVKFLRYSSFGRVVKEIYSNWVYFKVDGE